VSLGVAVGGQQDHVAQHVQNEAVICGALLHV